MIISKRVPNEYTNPPYTPYMWTNTTTGEVFICVDNTKDKNVWVGQDGTMVGALNGDYSSGLVYKWDFDGGFIDSVSSFELLDNNGNVAESFMFPAVKPAAVCPASADSDGLYSLTNIISPFDSGNYTIAFWGTLNASQLVQYPQCFTNGGGYGAGGMSVPCASSANGFGLYYGTSSGWGGSMMIYDEVQSVGHYIFSVTGHVVTGYLNGEFYDSKDLSTYIPPTGNHTSMFNGTVPSASMRGHLGDFRIYDRPLTQEDCYKLYAYSFV